MALWRDYLGAPVFNKFASIIGKGSEVYFREDISIRVETHLYSIASAFIGRSTCGT